MGEDLQLEFGNLEDSVLQDEEWKREYHEFRLMFIGLSAGLLASIPTQLLVEPLEVTTKGVVLYGNMPIGQVVAAPGYFALNFLLIVGILLSCVYGYRYVTGYYENPTVRLPHDCDTREVYDDLRTFLEDVDDIDIDVRTTHERIECIDARDDLILELKFDPGRHQIYLTYNPRNRNSRRLVEQMKGGFSSTSTDTSDDDSLDSGPSDSGPSDSGTLNHKPSDSETLDSGSSD